VVVAVTIAELEQIIGPADPALGERSFIYALVDPETDEFRYIGKSIRPMERLANHVNEAPSNCHRSHWIQSLKARDLRPYIVILESVQGEWPWQESERYWIARGRYLGWPLTNNTDGGDGVPSLPQETRDRITAASRGRKPRPETLEKLRIARRRRVTSDETRKKMSATQRGRVITWGAKLSAANRKITAEQVVTIKQRIDAGELVKDLAAEFRVHRTTISKINKGKYQ
jgi:hypothetical protein